MTAKERNISRGCLDYRFSKRYIHNHFLPFLGHYLLSFLLPALLYGCTEAAESTSPGGTERITKISMLHPPSAIRNMDIFVFRDDRLQTIDCYQRFDSMDEWREAIVSSGGERIITALANGTYTKEDWYKVRSRSYLGGVSVNLEDETREYPLMSGESRVNTHLASAAESLPLTPLAGEIRLNSLCCDFSGKVYKGERLTDVRAYLINVNAECGIIEDSSAAPRRIVNAGRLREEDIGRFARPDLILQEIPGEIGREEVHPAVSLRAYRSCHPKESPGTPFTRLVIEGRISGNIYYWPIDINRDMDEEPGIRRGRIYSYDVKITSKGSSDPDSPVSPEEITINKKVTQWKEMEEYEVSY